MKIKARSRLWLTALALCVMLLLSMVSYAQAPASATTDPEAEPDTTPRVTTALTPDGQATVLDTASDRDGKKFYTIQTQDGNVFYLVVDLQRGDNNAYFLNAVKESDLMAFAEEDGEKPDVIAPEPVPASEPTTSPEPEPVCICEVHCETGEVNTACSVCVVSKKDCVGKAPEPTEEPKAKQPTEGGNKSFLIILAVVLVVGSVGFYVKIYKPKHSIDDAEDFDDLVDDDRASSDTLDDIYEDDMEDVGYDEDDEPEEPDYYDDYDE